MLKEEHRKYNRSPQQKGEEILKQEVTFMFLEEGTWEGGWLCFGRSMSSTLVVTWARIGKWQEACNRVLVATA